MLPGLKVQLTGLQRIDGHTPETALVMLLCIVVAGMATATAAWMLRGPVVKHLAMEWNLLATIDLWMGPQNRQLSACFCLQRLLLANSL